MNNISELMSLLIAEATPPGADAASTAAAGMPWDGWLMLIIGIVLLYGGLGWCLWIAAGRGNKDAWKEEEE